ncbi:hypothetical protein [Streptomyces goshikiensis]|uniref:hypothetical protein n=1 Tax=Streptomyces goshikiensis TaxID=1942 RepID=UPI00366A2189
MTALKTAASVYPKGTPSSVCITHNRLIKAIEMAMAIRTEFGDQATPAMLERLTEADFNQAARTAGVHPPNSDETRDLVRLLVTVFDTATRPNPKGALLEALLRGSGQRNVPPGSLIGLVRLV